jgi:nucleotide-binding universal stress UspA family protein
MSKGVVIVPLDGSLDSISVLPIARGFVELSGGVVHIVHVAEHTIAVGEVLERIGLGPDEIEGSVLDPRRGPPADGILRAAAECQAEFIVLSTHTAAFRGDEVIGSTALDVVRRAPCPVVLVRPESAHSAGALRPVPAGHAGPPATSAAIRPAADLAIRADARLEILHAAGQDEEPPHAPGSMGVPRYLDQPQHEWPAWTTEFVRRFLTESLSELAHVRLALAHGEPGVEIVRHASRCDVDLIVLSWKGDFRDEHAPTVKTVLRDAPCPVMIVRTEPAELAAPLVRRRPRRHRPGAHAG